MITLRSMGPFWPISGDSMGRLGHGSALTWLATSCLLLLFAIYIKLLGSIAELYYS